MRHRGEPEAERGGGIGQQRVGLVLDRAALMAFTVAGGRITAIDGITDPRRLRRLLP